MINSVTFTFFYLKIKIRFLDFHFTYILEQFIGFFF